MLTKSSTSKKKVSIKTKNIFNSSHIFVTILGKKKATQKALEVSNAAISTIQKFQYGTENLVSLAKYTVNRHY